MDYALIENGQVVNLISLHPDNAADFPSAVPLNGVPVQIGDTLENGVFYRNGEPVRTVLEEMYGQMAELDAALLEVQYQQLIGGLEE